MIVLVFGQLKEITGSDRVNVPAAASTEELVEYFAATYPAMAELKYLIAVDKEIIQENTMLTDKNTIALLPPYAGG
jgi:sulfur-carrier protein